MNKHEAMSHHSSLGNCEPSHCVTVRNGTWINISEILAEEETMSEADAFFSSRLGMVFS
nr:hypothetical protein [Evansella caseinilytica]